MSGNGKGENMLIEKVAFNFNEVGEKSLTDIKNECLVSFAYRLQEALTSTDEKIRKFWLDSSTTYAGDSKPGSIANYKTFQDLFGSKIKYNSKNIVFEETIYNGPTEAWSVRETCASVYGLEWVEPVEADCSPYYQYRKDNLKQTCNTCCEEFVGTKKGTAKEILRNFYSAFGVGEFPFMTITIIRLGNKDHYFYDIHR